MTLAEIKENNLSCVIKVDSKEEAVILFEIFNPNGYDANYAYDYLMVNYWKGDGTVCFGVTGNKINGFDTETYYKKNEEQYGKIYRFKDLIAKEGIVGTFKGTPVYADGRTLRMADGTIIGEFNTGGVLPTDELIKKEFDVTWIDKIALPTATETKEMVERVRREILKFTNAFPKEDKKLKFTFYTEEGYRIDKSNNSKIETITTEVLVNGKDYQCIGSATCDKADYDEREGVLNAIANALFGNFDRELNKVVKAKALANKKSRTCKYCGQVFDTVEEKQEHEAWHIECRKARRERYLLRKRAKQIAFEEAAQKLAKEMTGDKK